MKKKEPLAAILFTEHFRKWRQRTPLILQRALIFASRKRKWAYFLLNFKKWELKSQKRSQIFTVDYPGNTTTTPPAKHSPQNESYGHCTLTLGTCNLHLHNLHWGIPFTSSNQPQAQQSCDHDTPPQLESLLHERDNGYSVAQAGKEEIIVMVRVTTFCVCMYTPTPIAVSNLYRHI